MLLSTTDQPPMVNPSGVGLGKGPLTRAVSLDKHTNTIGLNVSISVLRTRVVLEHVTGLCNVEDRVVRWINNMQSG